MEFLTAIWDHFFIYALAFVIVLSVLVFVHEWGHYIVARMCGVKVTTFSIGFGPEIWGINDKSGTRWKLSAIPLGGFVQMFGDADPSSSTQSEGTKELSPAEKQQAFFCKPLWQRAAIVFAGPAINFLFAIFLLFGLYMTIGKPVTPPVVSAVMEGSAADKAGIRPYDRIIRINNVRIERFDQIQREIMVALDTATQITVMRDGEEIFLGDVYPERQEFEDRFGFKQSRGVLGVVGPKTALDISAVTAINGQNVDGFTDIKTALSASRNGNIVAIAFGGNQSSVSDEQSANKGKQSVLLVQPFANETGDAVKEQDGKLLLTIFPDTLNEDFIRYNVMTALIESVRETGSVVHNTFEALGQMITGVRGADELGGIVRIGAIAGDAAQAGFIALITFTALLSINLGLINLFPIPVLDGGHLLFYAIEAIKGSPVSETMQEYAFKFGFVFLIGLMLFANLNDLIQLVF